MAGKKVIILPVWHNISSAEMNAILPIQADKVALRSSDGVEAVAKALVDVVRPDLLNLDVQKGFAFDTAGTFVKLAKAQYPATTSRCIRELRDMRCNLELWRLSPMACIGSTSL